MVGAAVVLIGLARELAGGHVLRIRLPGCQAGRRAVRDRAAARPGAAVSLALRALPLRPLPDFRCGRPGRAGRRPPRRSATPQPAPGGHARPAGPSPPPPGPRSTPPPPGAGRPGPAAPRPPAPRAGSPRSTLRPRIAQAARGRCALRIPGASADRHEVDHSAFGRELAHLRRRRGLSQQALSRLAGCSPAYVSKIETGPGCADGSEPCDPCGGGIATRGHHGRADDSSAATRQPRAHGGTPGGSPDS